MDVHLKRRQREQERQKRERLVQSKAESFPSQVDTPSVPPHFGSLIKRNDANNDELSRMSKHILGPVDMFQVAMSSMNHQQLLGTFESTPGTPLHPVTGNPFDRQFVQGTNAAALTTTAALSSASSLATTAFTSASSASSSAGSSAQSRSELNRHSVAEPPNSTREEKAGKVRGSHGRSDHTSSGVKQSKQPGDSSAFSTSKSIHKKSSKVRDEGSNDLSSRPTNVLVVKKSKEKSRVRPYKTSARSPTGNQPGPVVTKKPSGGAPSQGAGDLFKVDPNRSSSSLAPTPSAPDGGPTRTPTPPVTKKQPKLKKRHSHHFSSAAPTSSADPQPTLPPPAIRKSNSVHSSQSHPSSSSTPHVSSHPSHSHSHPSSSSTSHTSSTAHHKQRKQSSSTTHSSHSSAPPPPPHTTQSPSPALPLKKHSSNSSSSSLQSSISHHHSSSSYDKEREKTRGSDSSVSRHSQALTSKSGSSFAQETSSGSLHSAAPIASSSVATTTVAGRGSSVSAVGSKSVKKKKKKARKEREKEKEEEKEKEREREREWERPREKERTSTQKPERPVVKPEPLGSVAEPLLAKSTPHYPSPSLGSNLFNPAHQSQQQALFPGNQPLLTFRDQTTGGRAGSKVKLEKLRPTNLNIDALDDFDETSMDTGDVQHLLKELICNVSVPPLITPLLTPKKETFPFTFPQSMAPLKHESLFSSHETPPTGPAHPLSDSDSESSGSSSESSSDSSDSDNDDNEQGLGKSMGRVGVAVSTSACISMEEGEDSTTPGWEKILPSVGGSITPLTKTPPYPHTPQLLASVHIPTTFHMPNTVLSPLAPETRTTAATAALPLTLSPPHSAASSSSISSFGSFGSFTGVSGFVLGTNVQPQVAPSSVPGDNIFSSSFSGSLTAGQPIYSQAAAAAGEMHTRTVIPDIASLAHPLPAAEEHTPHHEEETASSSSESEDDLGSESDDESSDAEDNSSDEEEDANETGPRPAQGLTAKQSAGNSSVSSATIFTGDDPIFNFPEENSGGFFNGADFFYQLQGGSGRDSKDGEGGESISRDLSTEAHWLTGETAVAAGANLPDQLGKAGEHRSESPLMAAFSSSQQQQQQHLASHAPLAANSTSSEILSGTQAPPSTTITTAITSITDSNNPVDQPFGSNTDRPIPIAATHSIISKQHSLNDSCSSGKKRKLERQASLTQDPSSSSLSSNLQPPARKALRVGSGHRPVQRRDNSLSSFSVSSDSSSGSSDSSDEESETEDSPTFPVSPQHTHSPKNPTFPPLPLLLPTSTPSGPASYTSPPYLPPSASPTHQHHFHAGVQEAPPVLQGMFQPQRQLEAGELDEDEVEEGEEVEREEKKGEIGREVDSLWVKIPLQKVDLHREQKPKAKVEPYVNVTLPSKPPRRRSTIDSSSHEDLPRLPDRHANDTRNMYPRPREREDDHHAPYSRGEFHRDEGRRPHRSSVWESERDRNDSWSGRHGMRANRSRDRERDHHRGGRGDWSEYPYEDSRSRGRGHPSNRHMNMTAEDFLREARKRKHEADKTRTPGIEKAKAYLESVTYFMRHGDAIERDAQTWDGAQTKNPFRLYMDTISLMKYCQSWANDCKQLVALCMKCMSVLYWKLFLLKQTTASHIQRDLQEFFLPSKTQKSPFLSSLSPIPSPASVGSTTSTGSGGGGASTTAPSQDPSPSSHVTVPKLIFNKAADHLTITSYLHQSLELWQQSNLIVEQYGEFFSSIDRRSGRITQYSPISTVADWLETGAARLVRYRS